MIEKVREMLEAIADHLNSDDSDLDGLTAYFYDECPGSDEEIEAMCEKVLEHLLDDAPDFDEDRLDDREEL